MNTTYHRVNKQGRVQIFIGHLLVSDFLKEEFSEELYRSAFNAGRLAADIDQLNRQTQELKELSRLTGYSVPYPTLAKPFQNEACFNCTTNPKNGGPGFCNCTLGSPSITC